MLKSMPNKLGIKNFRDVFMRDLLPEKSNETECDIINLDIVFSPRTHWKCYFMNNNHTVYFDSYGDANPLIVLVKYLHFSNL